jgi:hypothetical protein
MAQFDVHVHPGRMRDVAPFLVVVQSARSDQSPSQLVIPLIAVRGGLASELAPAFQIRSTTVYLHTLQMFSILATRLGPAVASLADDTSAGRIIAAIDEVITTAYR